MPVKRTNDNTKLSAMKTLIEKASLMLLFLVAVFSSASAQTNPTATDKVHLKSGQAYEGIIVEQKPGESVRLWRTAEADTLLFIMDSIDRITKIVPTTGTAGASTGVATTLPARRFNANPLSVALQVSNGGGDYSVIGFGAIIQKHFPDERAWAGVGLHYLGAQNGNGVNTMPIVYHSSYELTSGGKGRLGTLGFLDLGYSVNLGDNYFDEIAQVNVKYSNGFYFNTGLRFRVNVLRNSGVWFDLGYLYQTSKLRNVETNQKLRTKSWHVFQVKGAVFF